MIANSNLKFYIFHGAPPMSDIIVVSNNGGAFYVERSHVPGY